MNITIMIYISNIPQSRLKDYDSGMLKAKQQPKKNTLLGFEMEEARNLKKEKITKTLNCVAF